METNKDVQQQFVAKEAELRKERGGQHAALWQDLSRFPSVGGGFLRASSQPDLIEATIYTKQRDLVGRKTRQVGRQYACRLDSTVPQVNLSGGFGWEVKDVLLTSPSPSRNLLALVTNHTPEPPAAQQAKLALEVWEGSTLIQHVPIHECHGGIYNDETFGTMTWSRDEKRVAYLAEPKREEKDFPSFWDVSPKDEPKNKENQTPEKERGKWHDYNEDWGETYPGKANPKPHVLDLQTGKVRALAVPANISFGHLRWLPDGKRILAVGWETTERRLGIVYCTNRRSSVYLIGVDGDDDGKLTKLSDNDVDVSTLWSVPSPNGQEVIYVSSSTLAPHNSCVTLRSVKLNGSPTPRTIVPIVDVPSPDSALPMFPGLFNTKDGENLWLNDETLVTTSIWGSRQVLLAINISTGAITNISLGKLHGDVGVENCDQVSWNVLDVRKDESILAVVSSPSYPPTPCLGKILSFDGGVPRIAWSLFPDPTSSQLRDSRKRLASIKHFICSVSVTQGEHGPFEVICVHEDAEEAELAAKRVLVLPHGGPHATFTNDFQPLYPFFALQGYVVLLINYRGSLGYGEKPLETLLGRCGSQDVADVMQGIDHVTKTLKKGDPSKLFVCGGSHGGFLTCHVVGQHPDRFVGAVARNPVVNVAAMLSITDIPDWCLVEALGANAWEEKKEVVTKEDVMRLWEASPIAHVSKVKTPTMVQSSFDDRRVPPSQGREFYNALRRLGVPTRLLTYESNAHAIIKVESEGDAWINAALWFDAAAALSSSRA